MKARWIQINDKSPQHWVVADEDDEVIATVTGHDQQWGAWITNQGLGGIPRRGCFLSRTAAKKAVEGWLGMYQIEASTPGATA